MNTKPSKVALVSFLLTFITACSSPSQSVNTSDALLIDDDNVRSTSSLKTSVLQSTITSVPTSTIGTNFSNSAYLGSGLISENDLLEIDVYKNEDLKTKVRVSKSGHINFPLLNKVYARGLDATQLAQKIQKKLEKDFLVEAHVNVLITESSTENFTIEGSVNKSGVYPVSGKTTLLQAIARAGGLSKDADTHHATLLRNSSNGDVVQQAVDIAAIRRGQLQDILLLRGDRIVIQKAVYNRVTVTGAVEEPGIFPLSEGITVLQAITQSGGFSTLAHKDHVVLVRPNPRNGSFNKYRVNIRGIMLGDDVDPKVQADDRIIVIESRQKVLLEEMIKILSPITSLNSLIN